MCTALLLVCTPYYPQRPARLEDVCLYNFVANYDRYGKDANGDRKSSKLKKPLSSKPQAL